MTDIKEPINTTSNGTFLSVVCEIPEKSVVCQKLVGPQPPQPPQELPPCLGPVIFGEIEGLISYLRSKNLLAKYILHMPKVMESLTILGCVEHIIINSNLYAKVI